MIQAIGTHQDDTGTDGDVKHIAHLLTTANLLANQNGFGNGIVPEDAATFGIRHTRQAGLGFRRT